jgi:hypothetical protein
VSQKGKRGKSKSKSAKSRPAFEWVAAGYRMLVPLGPALGLFAVVGVAVIGLERLKDRVYARPEFHPEIKLELDLDADEQWVAKEGWQSNILASIDLSESGGWLDEGFSQAVADQLVASGWVSSVDGIVQNPSGVVRIACAYRRPVAMLRIGEVYVATDKDGYRLRGTYPDLDGLSWIRIVGIQSAPPDVGEPFEGDDAVAGIRLASLLEQQPREFASRIDAVDVSNFAGRQDRRKRHINVLPVPGQGGKCTVFGWGSPLGEEIEETTPEQKLQMMYRVFATGSVQAEVDLTTYPNAVIVRPGELAL